MNELPGDMTQLPSADVGRRVKNILEFMYFAKRDYGSGTTSATAHGPCRSTIYLHCTRNVTKYRRRSQTSIDLRNFEHNDTHFAPPLTLPQDAKAESLLRRSLHHSPSVSLLCQIERARTHFLGALGASSLATKSGSPSFHVAPDLLQGAHLAGDSDYNRTWRIAIGSHLLA